MTELAFEQRDLDAFVPDLNRGGEFHKVPLSYRVDPLLGHSARIITGTKLQPTERTDLTPLVTRTGFCPFCSDTVDSATFPFPEEVIPEGRLRQGSALVVPNIMAYSTYSAVGIYDTQRHFIDISEFNGTLLADAMGAMVTHCVKVRQFDKALEFSSINANYLPSSGSSLVHPHLQSSHDYVPLSYQRMVINACATYFMTRKRSYVSDLLDAERSGPRFVGTTGRVQWLTPFAPSGFHEVWGVLPEMADIPELEPSDIRDLATGMAKVLQAFARANLTAFNFSLQGGGAKGRQGGFELYMRIISRAPVEPYYRSDITYFEKLGLEAMIDLSPEDWATTLRASF